MSLACFERKRAKFDRSRNSKQNSSRFGCFGLFGSAGFYQPVQDGDSSESGKSSSGEIDFRQIVVFITEKTGWTPQQIRELTIDQIKQYGQIWSNQPKDGSGLTVQDIELFNLESGIKAIKKHGTGNIGNID